MNFTNLDVILIEQIKHFFGEMDRVAIIINVFEILSLVFILYYLYRRFIKGTQSENLVRGSLALVVMWGISELLIRINLNIFGVFLRTLVSIIAFALIVIFQPELRRFLGYIGQGNLFEKLFLNSEGTFTNEKKIDVAKELIETIKYLSKSKTGGLIVLQKDINPVTNSDVGVKINADISQELLLTIFFPKTPLHDGAVIIKEDKIDSAGVLLPLTEDPKLSWRYGTRHRAAIGVSEHSNCACIVVSEETGDVSVAIDGILKKYEDLGKLKSDLIRILGYKQEEKDFHEKSFIKFDNIFGKNR